MFLYHSYLFFTEECRTLNGCEEGEAKITFGYKLPAKNVIHTVGPMGEVPSLLQSCYINSVACAIENDIKVIAFPCISTGIYGYPNVAAAKVALESVRLVLESNYKDIERIIFVVFLNEDEHIYKKYIQYYFPPE